MPQDKSQKTKRYSGHKKPKDIDVVEEYQKNLKGKCSGRHDDKNLKYRDSAKPGDFSKRPGKHGDSDKRSGKHEQSVKSERTEKHRDSSKTPEKNRDSSKQSSRQVSKHSSQADVGKALYLEPDVEIPNHKNLVQTGYSGPDVEIPNHKNLVQTGYSGPVLSMAPYFGFGEGDAPKPINIQPYVPDILPKPTGFVPLEPAMPNNYIPDTPVVPNNYIPDTPVVPNNYIPDTPVVPNDEPIPAKPIISTDLPYDMPPPGCDDGWETRVGKCQRWCPPSSDWVRINTRNNQCPDPTDFIYDPVSCAYVNKYHIFPNRYRAGPVFNGWGGGGCGFSGWGGGGWC